jgi:site-specific DNA-methyltransferase (adenine-specific)
VATVGSLHTEGRSCFKLKTAFYTKRGIMFSDDCLKVLKSLKSNSINCVFADPPFNLGKCYNKNITDNVAEETYINWCKVWLHECVRVLKNGGSLFLYNIPRWNILLSNYLMTEEAMLFRNWIAISIKNGPPRGKRLYPAHYSLSILQKDNLRFLIGIAYVNQYSLVVIVKSRFQTGEVIKIAFIH